MEMGTRIYYDKRTGEPFFSIGARSGDFMPSTVEQDIEKYRQLSERNRDTYDVLELEYGQYEQDFAESNGYRVNPETKELEFSYPDPNEPTAPPVFQKALSEQIEELKAENLATMGAVAEVYELLLGGM